MSELRVDRWPWWVSPRLRCLGGAAVQVTSAPALTVEPDASLPTAARVMYRRNDRRAFGIDDNVAVAERTETGRRDPLHAWWIGRQPAATVDGQIVRRSAVSQ